MVTSVLAVNNTVPPGSISLNPPSPRFTVAQVVFMPSAVLEAGEPLSCVPPRMINGLVAFCEKEMNCVSEPMLLFSEVIDPLSRTQLDAEEQVTTKPLRG